MPNSYGDQRSSELDGLINQLRGATLIDGQLLINKGRANIQNCLYLIEREESIWEAAQDARDHCLAFAQMLERHRSILMPEKRNVEALRERAIEKVKHLQRAIKEAKPSIEATHLGLG